MNGAKPLTDVLVSVSKNVVKHLPRHSVSVYGTAPSLSKMKTMKSTFRGAYFWYHYRVYYPYLFPPLFLIFMIVALTGWNNVVGHLVLGSILSLIGGLSVVASYIMITPWRKHPSTLVLYRALTSIAFSIAMIADAMSVDSQSCRSFAVFTQLTLLSGECWLTTIASDLVNSLTNPFSSYKANLNRYLVLVWLFTGFITFVFYFDTGCQGLFHSEICWLNITDSRSPCLWGYYLFWIIAMYTYQIWAFIFAYFRLKRGLSATFDVRIKCAQETFKCLLTYAIYLFITFFIFAIISSEPEPKVGSNMSNFSLFFLFIVANRGSVDGIVWFMLHDFEREESPDKAGDSVGYEMVPLHHETGSSSIDAIKEKSIEVMKELADLAIAEVDETDLSPQVNMALRQQIVQYVTQGVRNSILRENLNLVKKLEDGVDGVMHRVMNMRRKDAAVIDGLEVNKFYLDGEHTFKEFGGNIFRELRRLEGIDDGKYLDVLSRPANERLSEGASGAFMFFCGGGEFIVKTIRAREALILHRSLKEFSEYIAANPDSLLCRFLGSYSLRMYDQTFYFVVMLNCFDPHAQINERFDIKGSWVGRSADPVKPSKRVVCRHCNTYFIPKAQEQCNVVVGKHEANVVLKDNDFRIKISLHPLESRRVLNIIKRDSYLLGKLGVLDYSLLIGIRKYKFDVNVNFEELGLGHLDDPNNQQSTGSKSTFKASSVTGPAVYYLGIVDFLQHWSSSKKVERLAKTYLSRKDPDGLSVMEPGQYMLRFQSKMDQIFDLDVPNGNINEIAKGDIKGEEGVVNPLQADFNNVIQSPSLLRVPLPSSTIHHSTAAGIHRDEDMSYYSDRYLDDDFVEV